jgi:hypothetical protein
MKKVASLFFAAALATIVTGCGSSNSTTTPQNVTTSSSAAVKPPAIISTTQSSSANQRVFVGFSHAMDASTINPTNLSISGASSSVSYDAKNRIAYLTPSTQLVAGTTYGVNVSKGVRDMNGVNLSGPFNFAISTKASLDTTAPTVINFSTGCVSANGPITVTFSEDIDSSTLSGSTFIVDGVTGTVSYDSVTHIASFTPNSPLTPGATYNVTITTGVTDLAGNHLGANLPYGSQNFVFTITVCTTPPPTTFCSYSKGGYAGPGAPGQLLSNNYTTVFSSGLTIGINDAALPQHDDFWTADSTGLSALQTFLTSPAGGPSGALTVDATNPTATDSGNLPTHAAALTINIGLSGTGSDPAGFGNLVLHDTGTSLDGSTVSEILAAANNALAGNGLPDGFTFSDLNSLIDNINQSWDNCSQSDWGAAHLSVAAQ